ncbi:sugar kinase [Deinococcus antarcticus]|uniref:Sugar kinase n=1 Tax=Deinococcus antarcticus TaxID=1298767 RepID=A0ABV8A6R6_9DEIO
MTVAIPEPRPLDLIGLGECMVELRADGPLREAPTLTRACGGDVLNALVSAARHGSRSGFITRVGNDPFGPGLLAAWQAENLDLTHAPLVEGENGVYFISLLENGEREFTYRRAGSAASQLSPSDIDPAYIASARMLLLSGITQAISASAQAATLRAAQVAQEHSTLVAFDPNYRPKLWAERGGVGAAQQAFREVLPFVNILLPSYPADSVLLGDTVSSAEEALAAFNRQAPLVALKSGADGAWLSSTASLIPAVKVTHVLDTTGAGDAWNGAFLHALLTGKTPTQAAQLAHQTAAYSIGHRGGIPPRPQITTQSQEVLT